MGVGLYLSVFYGGFYLRLGARDGPSVPFRTEGISFQRWNGQGYDAMLLRGVDISSSLPEHYASSYAPTEADYLRWLKAIGEMGANAVRAASILDDDFYNALYAYNTSHPQPLYLLQGFGVSDSAGFGSKDAYDKDFLDALLRNGRGMVDVVHGRKNQAAGMTWDGSSYRKDVSPWTAGFLVGIEWSPDTISYTDHSALRSGVYQGTYFQTTADATPFEAVMAQVMDGIARYETDKYNAQRPIGFLCAPSHDFLEYEEIYARQLAKHARTDPEHVVPLPSMEAGRFAAYQLYDFCDSFSVRLSAAQRQALGPLLEGLSTGEPYGGYLELLGRYHTMPVIAAGYGFSSSRGAAALNTPPQRREDPGPAAREGQSGPGVQRLGRGLPVHLAGRVGADKLEHRLRRRPRRAVPLARSPVGGPELRPDGLRAGGGRCLRGGRQSRRVVGGGFAPGAGRPAAVRPV